MSGISNHERKVKNTGQRRKNRILALLLLYLALLLFLTILSGQKLNSSMIHVREGNLRQDSVNGVLYDKTLPLSAVYWDEKGSCVYEVTTRETPLGSRAYVSRIPAAVKETDMDAERAAVEVSLDYMSRIVIWSSAELEDRAMVLIEEE